MGNIKELGPGTVWEREERQKHNKTLDLTGGRVPLTFL